MKVPFHVLNSFPQKETTYRFVSKTTKIYSKQIVINSIKIKRRMKGIVPTEL